ncbi:MAG: hypothetical protein ACRERC_20565 [Candidatus Binatia bacterium]
MVKVDKRPRYESPKITAMDRDEVLQVFQMSAAQISAAGCWWAAGCATSTPCVTGNPL